MSSIFRRIFAIWFVSFPSNVQLPICLLCRKLFSNEAMKPSPLSNHLEKKHADKKDNPVAFFQDLKDKFRKRNTITSMMTNCLEQLVKDFGFSQGFLFDCQIWKAPYHWRKSYHSYC